MNRLQNTFAALCGTALILISPLYAGELSTAVAAEGHDLAHSSRASDHAPIGVMAEHTHEAGEFMLSYRYMSMPMTQNYIGSNGVSDQRALRDFSAVPTRMDMEMHMLGLMYAPTDRITLAFMAPYTLISMDHLRRDGERFTTEAEGWGDLSLSSLITVLDTDNAHVHLNFGVGIPTGSITEKDDIPGPGLTQLPYPMQLGSGSWSIKPGATYTGRAHRFSWGAQVLGNIFTGDNSQGYRLGNSIDATTWVAYDLDDQLSSSLRIAGSRWDNIDGAAEDLLIPATVIPTADPNLRGGSRIDLGIGLNYVFRKTLRGHRLAVEALLPIYQNLNGPQLGSEWSLIAGWQFAF